MRWILESERHGLVDEIERRHPLLSLLLWQIASALLLIGAVGGIALAGGGVIWMFYVVGERVL